ncbi:MAG: hypothetical protein CMI02_10580 [Oceanospirillaceae bacterium]|nr:hypothetical protein [Oceanospirillaceae bacterium]
MSEVAKKKRTAEEAFGEEAAIAGGTSRKRSKRRVNTQIDDVMKDCGGTRVTQAKAQKCVIPVVKRYAKLREERVKRYKEELDELAREENEQVARVVKEELRHEFRRQYCSELRKAVEESNELFDICNVCFEKDLSPIIGDFSCTSKMYRLPEMTGGCDCNITLCSKCILPLLRSADDGRLAIKCPTCRKAIAYDIPALCRLDEVTIVRHTDVEKEEKKKSTNARTECPFTLVDHTEEDGDDDVAFRIYRSAIPTGEVPQVLISRTGQEPTQSFWSSHRRAMRRGNIRQAGRHRVQVFDYSVPDSPPSSSSDDEMEAAGIVAGDRLLEMLQATVSNDDDNPDGATTQ